MKLKQQASINRRNKTSMAEAMFLKELKTYFDKKTRRNYKYQAVIGNMIVDFWLKLKALVIEIDGPEHDKAKDARRDAFLLKHGLTTIRFSNDEVIKYPISCVRRVMEYPDVFSFHGKASGSIYKLLMNGKHKIIGLPYN